MQPVDKMQEFPNVKAHGTYMYIVTPTLYSVNTLFLKL
jgi:hypothetical protein